MCSLTVLMPVYNAEEHVKDAIDSVLNQTYSDFTLLIINDGSTDNSSSIIRNIKDERIEVLDIPNNQGLVHALNTGLARIESKYIARADADDICLPDRFQSQIEFLEKHPNVGALGTGFDSLLKDGSINNGGRFSTDHNRIRLTHLWHIQIIHGTAMLRNAVIKKHRLEFDSSFQHAEDYDFFDRIGDVSELANIAEPHYIIRHHEKRVSQQFAHIQKENSNKIKLRILKRIGVEGSVQDLELIQWLMYQNYGWFDEEKAKKLALLVNRICEANNESNYLDSEFMRRELSTPFLHLCNYLANSNKNMLKLLKLNKTKKISDSPKLHLSILAKSMLKN